MHPVLSFYWGLLECMMFPQAVHDKQGQEWMKTDRGGITGLMALKKVEIATDFVVNSFCYCERHLKFMAVFKLKTGDNKKVYTLYVL